MISRPLYRAIRHPIVRAFGSFLSVGPLGSPLLFIDPDGVDSIGLSVADYDLIGATWQPVFFTDPTTPIIFADFAALYAAVSAVGTFNAENVMGTEAKGVAVYDSTTDRSILNRALVWFGLDPIYAEFGPTWNDADVWEDTALWTE